MRTVVLVVVATFACSSLAAGPGGGLDETAFRREVAARGVDPDAVVSPFACTPEMRAWAADTAGPYAAQGGLRQLSALQDALFARDDFPFTYDEQLTLTAAEAFAVRRGNCMAFTAMFVALARSLGLPATLVAVRRAPDIARVDGLVVVNRHVVAGYRTANGIHLFDFFVSSAAPYVHHRQVDDVEAAAMFHTNLGGEAIRAGELAAALRHLELATVVAPHWEPGWVDLGVARARLGDRDGALAAYRTAMAVEPGSSSALANMAALYRSLGLEDEARHALAAAARATANPFTLIALADLEMVRGRLAEARRHLRRARWSFGDEPEVYAALARLAERQGERERATSYRQRAARLASAAANGGRP